VTRAVQKVPPRPWMGPLARIALLCVLALGVESLGPSCSTGINLGPIRAFNRPVSVAFACINTTDGTAVPTSQCALIAGVAPTGFSMHALVPQETRGEVAAADLITRTVLDSDRRIPGYTFVPVGSLPGAIIVPPNHPRCTYVANRGSNDITVLETRRFRSTTSIGAQTFPAVDIGGSPTDMVLQPDETALWVALADEHVVIRLPILSECDLGEPDLILDLDDGSMIPAGVPVGASVDLYRTCPNAMSVDPLVPFTPVPPEMTLPREPEAPLDPLAAPATLAIDTEADVLLVGDRNLPLIHRIVLADGSLLSPIATGAPIRDVVVTPRVPDSYAPASVATTFSRYLYAIDESDGSVMAIEYSDETRADFGAVIPVDVEGSVRPDRIRLDVVARALEVLTPSYDETSPDDPRSALCDPGLTPLTTPGPSNLRGVFLSVAGSDGTIRFVDVYDLDAPCRGRQYGSDSAMRATDCTSPTIVGDVAVYIRRHRPRGSAYTLVFGGITTLPSVILGAATVPLTTNGTAGEASTVPSLVAIACPPHLEPIPLPGADADADTLVCGLRDPFAMVAETWSAAWQGSIPGTGTGSGNASPRTDDPIVIDASTDYCARGVIGSEDATNGLPADAPESGYAGDLLAITGALPPGQIESALCRGVVGVASIGEAQLPVIVPIRRAFSRPDGLMDPAYLGRLEIDPNALILGRPPFVEGEVVACSDEVPCAGGLICSAASDGVCGRALTIGDALDCYQDHLLTMDVRSQGTFTVIGGRTGFRSRVVRDPSDGHCAWDPSLDVLAQGRAFPNRPFANARIAFQLTAPITGNPDVRIVMTSPQSPLGIDLTLSTSGVRQISLPAYLSWSEPMGRLYAVDVERRGLVEMTVLPVGVSTTRFE
jgi:hypothetical protein